MKELHDWLREGDPIASEPPLSDADVLRMRQAVVAASREPQPFFGDWARGSWAAATVMVALMIAAGMHRWFTPLPEARRSDVQAPSPAAAPAGERRQVQMIAPGGTRVIWIFNADFQP